MKYPCSSASIVPKDISFTRRETTGITVKFSAPGGNPAIATYEANIKGGRPDKKCSVDASLTEMECTITDLQPATEYTISASACLPGANGCSGTIVKKTWTMPPG